VKESEFYNREMARLEKAWNEAESFVALVEAFQLCTLNNFPLPAWLQSVVSEMIDAAWKGEKFRPEKDFHTRVKRAGDKEKHYRRYLCVKTALRIQRLWGKREVLERAYETAAEKLLGTPFECEIEQMKNSYKKVEKDMLSGRESEYYDVGHRKY